MKIRDGKIASLIYDIELLTQLLTFDLSPKSKRRVHRDIDGLRDLTRKLQKLGQRALRVKIGNFERMIFGSVTDDGGIVEFPCVLENHGIQGRVFKGAALLRESFDVSYIGNGAMILPGSILMASDVGKNVYIEKSSLWFSKVWHGSVVKNCSFRDSSVDEECLIERTKLSREEIVTKTYLMKNDRIKRKVECDKEILEHKRAELRRRLIDHPENINCFEDLKQLDVAMAPKKDFVRRYNGKNIKPMFAQFKLTGEFDLEEIVEEAISSQLPPPEVVA